MADARRQERWEHTSHVLALLANIHRDPKKHGAFRPADFNPLARHARAKPPKANLRVLKTVFVDNRPGRGT